VKPTERVTVAVERWGLGEVIQRCISLLSVRRTADLLGVNLELAMVLGAVTDPGWFARGRPPGHLYWARVWAARALVYVWDGSGSGAIVSALADEQWRVREMAARVVRARGLAVAVEAVVCLVRDDVPRVRVAAARALGVVGEGEHVGALMSLKDDAERSVARAAQQAIDELSSRLDRKF